jgi:hypothetical protein
VPAQLSHGRQFTAFEISLADGGGGFINCEHHADMGGRSLTGKQHRKSQLGLEDIPPGAYR